MSKLKQRILMIAIAIILVFFIGIGIDTFYKSPEYRDFCDEAIKPVDNKDDSYPLLRVQHSKNGP